MDRNLAAVTMYSHFPISLNLPAGERSLLTAAAAAVHTEYVESVRWKELVAQRIRRVGSEAGLKIVEIDVGHAVHFDWTWEGASVLAAPASGEFDARRTPEKAREEVAKMPGGWWGDVVEVDAARGMIYVDVSDSDSQPMQGTFYVHPFEFLAELDQLYNDDVMKDFHRLLPARLRAASGGVHPPVVGGASTCLPELVDVWKHSWVDLWGPPGTGKTTLIGRQVARVCADANERILVVSTTNIATDEVAVASGSAEHARGRTASMVRVGRGSALARFRQAGLERMLEGTEVAILEKIGLLLESLHRARLPTERADLNAQIRIQRMMLKSVVEEMFANLEKRVVVTTAYTAMRQIVSLDFVEALRSGKAPFTTIVIDEAGLLPKATIAALSLLASRRIVLVGDPLQLSPITKISRALPTAQQEWMGSSALAHLTDPTKSVAGVHLLTEQHRMHPTICSVVARYQYRGQLKSASTVENRGEILPTLMQNVPRAVWYCIDEERPSHPSIRAQRGPGGRSFQREITVPLLGRIFKAPGMQETSGLFITPFVAQARAVSEFFAEKKIAGWRAGTVHSQQGVTVDMVIFDTVHAGSTAWSYAEWKRIINVAMSRARYFAMLIASRDEMQQPFLNPLLEMLPAVVMKSDHTLSSLVHVQGIASKAVAPTRADLEILQRSPLFGDQLSARKALRPLVSAQQQQLVNFKMDGGPRLVRGVAGSGKTFVLARWLIQTALRLRDLDSMIRANIAEAEVHVGREAVELALEKLDMFYVGNILRKLEGECGLITPKEQKAIFKFHERAREILSCAPAQGFDTRCAAMFIDEAQDMGADTLKLLISLIEPDNPAAPTLRPAHIFLDNAQNVYDRPVPQWSDLGLDMRGRSTVMKESFRATNPVTQFALNVFFRLRGVGRTGPQDFDDEDHKELYERDLIEPVDIDDGVWWRVRFNDVDGPPPQLHIYRDELDHDREVARQVRRWIVDEKVAPEDIVVLCHRNEDCDVVEQEIRRMGEGSGYGCGKLTGHQLARLPGMVLVTTAKAFKGYDAEIVLVAHAQQFCAREEGVLPESLYVALTRARSLLWVTAVESNYRHSRQILEVLNTCMKITDGRGVLHSNRGMLDR
ncbi:MAG: AAA domain-containing protein, partial [Chloroflexi bacterium]|nr:AAA domain-containing protein [Chloroflexota bacterium]